MATKTDKTACVLTIKPGEWLDVTGKTIFVQSFMATILMTNQFGSVNSWCLTKHSVASCQPTFEGQRFACGDLVVNEVRIEVLFDTAAIDGETA